MFLQPRSVQLAVSAVEFEVLTDYVKGSSVFREETSPSIFRVEGQMACTSEKLVDFHWTIRPSIPEGNSILLKVCLGRVVYFEV
jgi:hypothetical protein